MSQFQPPSWSFYLDTVFPWAYYDNAFTEKECKKIIEEGFKNKLKVAEVGDRVVNEKIRKGNISWMTPTDENFWIFERLTAVVLNLNDKYFKFDLFGITEPLQFTEYKSDNNYYEKHIDKRNGMVIRKLSISVQLTDSEDYEGGDLILYFNPQGIKISRDQGYLVLFPSYTLHEVTPVTKGTRYSLVAWVTGKNFI